MHWYTQYIDPPFNPMPESLKESWASLIDPDEMHTETNTTTKETQQMKSTYNQKLSDVVLSQDEIDRYEHLSADVRATAPEDILELLTRSKTLSTAKVDKGMDWPSAIAFILLGIIVLFIGVILR